MGYATFRLMRERQQKAAKKEESKVETKVETKTETKVETKSPEPTKVEKEDKADNKKKA